MVTFCAALVFPTDWAANVKLLVESVTAAVPVPVRFTICGLFAASSANVSVPVPGPTVVGEKVMPMTQVPPAATLVPHALLAMAKSPSAAIEEKLTATFSLLVSVIDFLALALPTTIFPKPRLLLERVTGVVPVPVKLAVCGLMAALSVIVKEPVVAPKSVGANETRIVQLAPPAKVAG